jgi:diguanylate cyclase (GGDEF)-like protein
MYSDSGMIRVFSLNKLLPAVAILLGSALAAWAAPPAPLTTLSAVHDLTNDQARQNPPVAFEATVTYFRDYEKTLFVQDGDNAIYVQLTTQVKLVPGDRVLIRGTMRPSFRPFVLSNNATLLHHGAPLKPLPATFDELIRVQRDCRLVKVTGVVRTADLALSSRRQTSTLRILVDGGYTDATIDSDDANALKDLLDAEVEVTGAVSGRFDGKMQQTGILLHVSSLADVKILKRAGASPWSLPATPMDTILANLHVKDLTPRVRVHGTITYYQPGLAVVLQSGSKSLWISTQSLAPLRIGDEADATGFPNVDDGFLTLTNAEIHDTLSYAPISPQPATRQDLTASKHAFDLVSVDGQVVTAIRQASQDEYALVVDGYMFSAIYRHPESAGTLSPIARIPVGSRVRVTGICVLDSADPFDRDVPFNILLRSPDDITLIASPSWLSIGNLIRLIGFLLIVVAVVSAWGWTLNRKVRIQTADLSARIKSEAALERKMAQLEKRRSRILEDINGTRPLAEILEQIIEMVCFGLDGALCWCEVTHGARLGNRPASTENLRIVSEQIPARSGPPLGTLFAGFSPDMLPSVLEDEALSLGARLASLAIETRRVYADLRHRSEFDLLTEINNRFSLDKHLDALIEDAREQAGIFGLVYVDLDEFKTVNDNHGHHIGDLYLQEVALRMKRQLRSNDLLARLGGDEFAALVPAPHNRAEVEEIALRLEHCMDEPFLIEELRLCGSASVGIAIYPEDGISRDALLNFADVAMYKTKHAAR